MKMYTDQFRLMISKIQRQKYRARFEANKKGEGSKQIKCYTAPTYKEHENKKRAPNPN